jgi:tetratricopeptide (TPR) repeat protein
MCQVDDQAACADFGRSNHPTENDRRGVATIEEKLAWNGRHARLPPPRMNADPSPAPSSGPLEPAESPPSLNVPGEADAEPRKFPIQKRRYRKPEDPDDEEEKLITDEVDEAALLSALLRNVRRRYKQRHEGGKQAGTRGNIKRFVARANVQTPPPASAVLSSPEPPIAAGEQAARPENGMGVPPMTPTKPEPMLALAARRSGRANRKPRSWIRPVLYFVFAAALILAAYLVERSGMIHFGDRTASADAATPAKAAVWRPADAAQWVQALDADHAGRLTKAFGLIDDLAKRVELTPEMAAYRASLQTRLGYFKNADLDLFRYLGRDVAPDTVATIDTARGFNDVRRRWFDDAAGCFAAVARANPYDIVNLVHWAETLRRQGHPTDAAAKFQEALTRLPAIGSPEVEDQRDYIAYELRLSQVESGVDLQPEIAKHLAAPAPSGYWLLTAAVAALQKGDTPAAAAAFQKARAALDPREFRDLMGDYFFRSFSDHPEMNDFLVPLSPAEREARWRSMEYFIDP